MIACRRQTFIYILEISECSGSKTHVADSRCNLSIIGEFKFLICCGGIYEICPCFTYLTHIVLNIMESAIKTVIGICFLPIVGLLSDERPIHIECPVLDSVCSIQSPRIGCVVSLIISKRCLTHKTIQRSWSSHDNIDHSTVDVILGRGRVHDFYILQSFNRSGIKELI